MKTKILIFIILLSISLANIDIPYTTRYSNIIKIENNDIYIFFKKPKNDDYENINVVFLTDDLKKIKIKNVKVIFNRIININETEKMKYETTLIERNKNEYNGKFRLLYYGFWKFKLIIEKNKKIYTFKDYFFYSPTL
ncbi:MAG: hypothetical protein C0625_05365 [Arcobacter sp.]|mgnify:CR=1 FL=1|nr:MAG: hypothetical protein C0625_05365 [Arcobacter sp.]